MRSLKGRQVAIAAGGAKPTWRRFAFDAIAVCLLVILQFGYDFAYVPTAGEKGSTLKPWIPTALDVARLNNERLKEIFGEHGEGR
jgi:hypothetical protein